MANEFPQAASVNRADVEPQSPLVVAQLAWRYRYYILLGGLLGLALGSLYYSRQVPVYQSTAQVLVIKKRSEDITGVKQLSIEDYMATHQVLIRSPLVVKKAIEKGRLKSQQMFEGRDGNSLAQAIMAGLVVQRQDGPAGGGSILEVSFRGAVAEECGMVVDAILESYKDFLDESYADVNVKTNELITEMRNVLEKKLADKEAAYRMFREENLIFATEKEGGSGHQELLASLQAKKSALILRRAELESQLNAIETSRKDGRSRAALLALVAEYSGKLAEREEAAKKTSNEMSDTLLPLLLEEQRLAESYGPKHPDLVRVRKHIAFIRELLHRASGAAAEASPSKPAPGSSTDPVDDFIEKVKDRLRELAITEQFFTEFIAKERKEAEHFIRLQTKEETFQKDISRLQQFYDGLVKRLHEIGLAQQAGGYVAQIISPPGIGLKVAPRLTPILLMAVLMGLLGGLGAAYLIEATDRRFRSPEEIRQRLGLPVVGFIPMQDPAVAVATVPTDARNGPVLSPALIVHHRSRSMDAEAYRGVRTALYFSTGGEGHKVVQVTSPNPGDGKTTVASNLAVCIAQSGKRTLLIDADLRRPMVQRSFGIPNRVGLASVIAGLTEPSAAIHDSGVPNLSVMLTGPIPPNPAELLTSARFHELLKRFREEYDIVIVDTPPLLAVTDPSVVAPRVDGVLLVIRLVKNGRPMAERAREILGSLGVQVFGVIVNGLNEKSGGYGYGYGYQYGGGYHAYRYRGYDDRETPEGTEDHANGAAGPVNGQPT